MNWFPVTYILPNLITISIHAWLIQDYRLSGMINIVSTFLCMSNSIQFLLHHTKPIFVDVFVMLFSGIICSDCSSVWLSFYNGLFFWVFFSWNLLPKLNKGYCSPVAERAFFTHLGCHVTKTVFHISLCHIKQH